MFAFVDVLLCLMILIKKKKKKNQTQKIAFNKKAVVKISRISSSKSPP